MSRLHLQQKSRDFPRFSRCIYLDAIGKPSINPIKSPLNRIRHPINIAFKHHVQGFIMLQPHVFMQDALRKTHVIHCAVQDASPSCPSTSSSSPRVVAVGEWSTAASPHHHHHRHHPRLVVCYSIVVTHFVGGSSTLNPLNFPQMPGFNMFQPPSRLKKCI